MERTARHEFVERGRADIHRPGGIEPAEELSGSHVEAPDACSIRYGHLEDRDVGDVVEREVTAEVSEVAGAGSKATT